MLSLTSLANFIGYPNIMYLWIYFIVTSNYHKNNDLSGNQYIFWVFSLLINLFLNICLVLSVHKFIITSWFVVTSLFLIFRLVNMLVCGESLGTTFFVMSIIVNVYICISLFLMGKLYLNVNKQWKLSNENVEDQTTGILKPHKGLNFLGLNWVKPTADAEVATAASDPVITTTN